MENLRDILKAYLSLISFEESWNYLVDTFLPGKRFWTQNCKFMLGTIVRETDLRFWKIKNARWFKLDLLNFQKH